MTPTATDRPSGGTRAAAPTNPTGKGTAGPGEPTHPGNVRSPDRRLFHLALAFAALPILVAAIRSGLGGWFPTIDTARAVGRANDVLSTHPPLVGLPASPSVFSDQIYSYLGAIEMYLLAVPTRLLGESWGPLLTMATLNICWFGTAMWLIRRRLGYRIAILGCLFGASVLWTIGSQILVDATPMRAATVAYLCLIVAAWSVADGDHLAFVPLAVATAYCIQTHPEFVPSGVILGIVSVAVWALRLRRLRRRDPTDWSAGRGSRRRHVLAAVALTVVIWIPPLVQQLFGNPGNITIILDSLGDSGSDPGAVRSLIDVIGVVSSPIVTWPGWLGNFDRPNFDAWGPTTPFLVEAVGVLVVAVLIGSLARNAWRRHDATVLTGFGVAVVTWGIWILGAFANPSADAFTSFYFGPVWIVAMFVWFLIAVGLVRSNWLPARLLRTLSGRPAIIGAVATTAVFATLNLAVRDFGAGSSMVASGPSRQIADAAARIDRGPVLVRSEVALSNFGVPEAVLGLQRSGVPFRVDTPYSIALYGSHRSYRPHPPNARWLLTITARPDPSRSERLIAHAKLPTTPAHRVRTAKMRAWAESAPVLRAPASLDIPDNDRAKMNRQFRNWSDTAQASGTSVIDDVWFMTTLSRLPESATSEMIRVPGLSSSDVHDWLVARSVELSNDVRVYLSPIPDG